MHPSEQKKYNDSPGLLGIVGASLRFAVQVSAVN